MIRTIIVDDETSARKTLTLMLNQYVEQVEVIGEASSVRQAIETITELKPDLVFLDIEMQDGTGFDVLQNLPSISFHVVFVTAYEQYALQSFRFAAIDYLLKPVRIKELRQTIERASTWAKPQIKTGQEFATIKKKVDSSSTKGQVVLVSELDGFSVVRWEEIVYCEAAKNYTVFSFMDGRKIIASRPLGEYETLLAEFGFMRIHKSFIVNLAKVSRYIKGRGGEVTMVDRSILPVARERKQDFLDYFEARFGTL
jgi:two-component system, LytTR family, response regulator